MQDPAFGWWTFLWTFISPALHGQWLVGIFFFWFLCIITHLHCTRDSQGASGIPKVPAALTQDDNDNIREGRITMKPTIEQKALIAASKVGIDLLLEDSGSGTLPWAIYGLKWFTFKMPKMILSDNYCTNGGKERYQCPTA